MEISDATVVIATNADMSQNVTTNSTDLQGLESYSIQVVYTGSPNGTLKLQLSNDNVSFSDYTGSSTSIAAAGSTMYKIVRNGERYVQAVFTVSSGSGTLNATLGKQG